MFSEEFRTGREHELVRGELAVLHGDCDVGIRAELRRKKGKMRNEWRWNRSTSHSPDQVEVEVGKFF